MWLFAVVYIGVSGKSEVSARTSTLQAYATLQQSYSTPTPWIPWRPPSSRLHIPTLRPASLGEQMALHLAPVRGELSEVWSYCLPLFSLLSCNVVNPPCRILLFILSAFRKARGGCGIPHHGCNVTGCFALWQHYARATMAAYTLLNHD